MSVPDLATLLPLNPASFNTALAAAKARLAASPTPARISLLPPNATLRQQALEAASALISAIPTPITDVWNPSTCPVGLLPYLAWGLSIDVWSPDWPESIKRERIRRAIAIQRMKGSAQSVADVVASYGGAITIREWFEQTPPASPHTFSAILSLTDLKGGAPSQSLVSQVVDDIGRTKPARSQFTFTLAQAGQGAVGVIGRLRPVAFARLSCIAPAA